MGDKANSETSPGVLTTVHARDGLINHPHSGVYGQLDKLPENDIVLCTLTISQVGPGAL